MSAIRDRVRSLGDWFDNINLRGVQTAPDQFLGDYPSVKRRRVAHAIPEDRNDAARRACLVWTPTSATLRGHGSRRRSQKLTSSSGDVGVPALLALDLLHDRILNDLPPRSAGCANWV